AFLTLDTIVFDMYRFHINSFTLELLFGGAAADIFQFHYRQYLLVMSAMLAVLILELFLFRWMGRLVDRSALRGGKAIIGALVLMMLSSHAMHAWAAAAGYRPITKISRIYPLYFPTTANRFFYRLGLASPDRERAFVDEAMTNETKDLRYPLHPIVADTASNMNILILCLDSWNYRAMDSVITPSIAALSKEGLYFGDHCSGSNGTRTGVFSLFYSIPGLYWYDVLGAQIGPILMDQLIRCHYEMGIFTSASPVSPPFDRTVFSRIKDLRLHTPGKAVHDRDIQITKDWLDFMDRYAASDRGRPFFGFLFYDAMHSMTHPDDFSAPFQPAWKYPRYEALNNDMDPTPFWNLYKNVTLFDDSLVGVVLSDLRNRGLMDSTIVIVTSDHGQEFNENKKGYWGHNGNYSRAQLSVPLVIRWPGMTPAVFTHWTSHYDIVPTLMQEQFHCHNAIEDFSIGRSLFDTTQRQWLIVGSHDNFGIIEPDRITSIYFDRSFDITDRHLNEIPEVRLNSKLLHDMFGVINTYYVK
ncbi:MAG TPA: DUF3413 domain-containing protein, partial [Candidatus Deferrimicrobium sp.]|nr:DUF3413 domain-containing protein [Candidatus Deferrimicrobium sp.]